MPTQSRVQDPQFLMFGLVDFLEINFCFFKENFSMKGLIEFGGAVRATSILGLPLLEFVGLVLTCMFIVYHVPEYLKTLWQILVRPVFGKKIDLSEFGKWAVVTGATDGIGKAYAEQLAEKGLNIVLISRSKSKLEDVAWNIEKTYGVETKVIVADFTNGPGVYDQIKQELEHMDIGMLINNIGIASELPNRFLDCEDSSGNRKYIKDILFCNVFPVTIMTSLVLPGMVARKKGIIVNVSSVLGLVPTPFLALYSATKAYTDTFTRSLTAEYENDGIIFQSLLPGVVQTKMVKAEKPSIFAPAPNTYVRSAIKTIGIEDRTSAHWTHRFLKIGSELLNFLFPKLTVALYYSLFEDIKNNWGPKVTQLESIF